MSKILCIVGARPNFMKIAPIMAALKQSPLQSKLIHTGQHYDVEMNERFFTELGIPKPDLDLEVGSGSHAVQTAEIMMRFEPVIDTEQPDAILVVGDVNSTIACALVAVKKGVQVIHVEAGLRSFDRTMPEEINRMLTDQLSDLLFTTERKAVDQLAREGIDPAKVHFVGNVMIDTLLSQLPKASKPAEVLQRYGVDAGFPLDRYGVLTMHRPSNVDHESTLTALLQTIVQASEALPILFPVHPRTKNQIEKFQLQSLLDTPTLITLPPLGYLDMLGINAHATVVLTDSGGIQEETTALGVPCITMRENTERPITAEEGTNTVVGTDAESVRRVLADVLQTGGKKGRIPESWDGHAAERIVNILEEIYL